MGLIREEEGGGSGAYWSVSGNCEEMPEKILTSTGFRSMTSAIPVKCSTNLAMKAHMLGAGQFQWVYLCHLKSKNNHCTRRL